MKIHLFKVLGINYDLWDRVRGLARVSYTEKKVNDERH